MSFDSRTAEWMTAAALWTAAVSLMIVGTFRQIDTHLGWGIFTAIMAALVSAHLLVGCIVKQERVRLETLAELAIEKARQRSGMSKLHT